MGFLDKVGSFLKREAKDLGDAAEGAKDKFDQELTKRERELKMTPSEKIAALQQEAAAGDAKIDAIMDKAAGRDAMAAAVAEVGGLDPDSSLPNVTHIVLPDGRVKSGNDATKSVLGADGKVLDVPIVSAPTADDLKKVEPPVEPVRPETGAVPDATSVNEPNTPNAEDELATPTHNTGSEDLPAPPAPAEVPAAVDPLVAAASASAAQLSDDLASPPAVDGGAEDLPAPPTPVAGTEDLPAPPVPAEVPAHVDPLVAAASASAAQLSEDLAEDLPESPEQVPAPPAVDPVEAVAEQLPPPPEQPPPPPAVDAVEAVAEELPPPPAGDAVEAVAEELPPPPAVDPVEAVAEELPPPPAVDPVDAIAEELPAPPAVDPVEAVAEELPPPPAAEPDAPDKTPDPTSPEFAKTPAQLKYERARAAANDLLDELRGELKEDGEI